jgi:hypothetical protein
MVAWAPATVLETVEETVVRAAGVAVVVRSPPRGWEEVAAEDLARLMEAARALVRWAAAVEGTRAVAARAVESKAAPWEGMKEASMAECAAVQVGSAA